MTRLIHLNGAPGAGKSTIAALYAERHVGVLDLDIDLLHPLVGGWRDPASDTHEILRPVAMAMAAAHLAGGRDVVIPQFRGRVEEIAAFREVARDSGADFVEVILLTDRQTALDRFEGRTDDTEWGRYNREAVAVGGGRALLGQFYDRLVEVVDRLPDAIVLPSEEGRVEDSYAALVRAVDQTTDCGAAS